MSAYRFTAENFEQEVLKSEKPVLVDFMTDWCGYCKMISPAVEDMAAEREDLKVGKLNVEEEVAIAEKYEIMTYPTLMLFEGGKPVRSIVAPKNKKQLQAFVDGQ